MSDFLQTKTIMISVLSLTWWIYSNDPTVSFYFPETSFRTSLKQLVTSTNSNLFLPEGAGRGACSHQQNTTPKTQTPLSLLYRILTSDDLFGILWRCLIIFEPVLVINYFKYRPLSSTSIRFTSIFRVEMDMIIPQPWKQVK